jgi:SdpI/YhfL family protein
VRRGLEKKSAGHVHRVAPPVVALRAGSIPAVSEPERSGGSQAPRSLFAVPLPVRLVLGSLLVVLGAALVAVAVLGMRRKLRRNRWAGVRTAASLRSDAAFAVANQVAAAPLGAAGGIALAGGAALLAGATDVLGWTLVVVSVVAVFVLAGVGGVAGDRAAAAVPAPDPGPSACGGACAGCDLVAGCRTAPAGAQQT